MLERARDPTDGDQVTTTAADATTGERGERREDADDAGGAGAVVGSAEFSALVRHEADRVCAVLEPLVAPLQAVLGPRSEVVLHNFARIPQTAVAIAGSLSGRAPGATLSPLEIEDLAGDPAEVRIGYEKVLSTGIVCRSTTVLYRDDAARPVAALCINIDTAGLLAAKETLEALTASLVSSPHATTGPVAVPQAPGRPVAVPSPAAAPAAPAASVAREPLQGSIGDLTRAMLDGAVAAIGVPVARMSKSHKVEVVHELDKRGFFLIREAADTAGAALGVSRFTIYNYLNEARGD